ncbi:MAG: hypothetical protein FWF05_03885, partial [Oscillospiraceae bacterium]|nr:hypothetical protein [Oscillospiraceae bacterium]
MKNIYDMIIGRVLADKKRRRIALAVFVPLLVAVVTLTTVLSLLPAFTTGNPICGFEEHTHDAGCYTELLTCILEESEAHTHGEDCYKLESVLACEIEEAEGHVHDETCYGEDQDIICGLEESEGHVHGEPCYEQEWVLACETEVSDGHIHNNDCYAKQLTCELSEHTHVAECYPQEDDSDAIAPLDGFASESNPVQQSAQNQGDGQMGIVGASDLMDIENSYEITPAPAIIKINIKKTTSGTGIPTTNQVFGFTLFDSDASGGQGSIREEINVTRNSSNPAPTALFPMIELKEEGTTYYLVRETSAPGGWLMDDTYYHIRVVVTLDSASNSYVASIQYRTKKGASGTYGNWMEYSPGEKYAMFSKMVRLVEQFPKQYVSTATNNALMNPTGSPTSRNGAESALLNALYPVNSSLTVSDLNMMFGIDISDVELTGNITIPGVGVKTSRPHRDFIRGAAYIYELKAKYPSLDLRLSSTWSNPTVVTDATERSIAAIMAPCFEALTNNGNNNLTYFYHLVDNMEEIKDQHDLGKTTSLSMSYTHDSATSGTITFSHIGWVSENIAEVEQYDTVLTWPDTTGWSVEVGDAAAVSNCGTGVKVKKGDTITVTRPAGSPSITFTLKDNAKYVKGKSIKGSLFTASAFQNSDGTSYTDKDFLLGVAQFVTLENTLTVSGSSGTQHGTASYKLVENPRQINPSAVFTYVQTNNESDTFVCSDMLVQDLSLTFNNTYGAADATITLDVKKIVSAFSEGTGAPTKIFNFTLTQVNSSGNPTSTPS